MDKTAKPPQRYLWPVIFVAAFFIYLALSAFLPPSGVDSVYYSAPGNAFYLQWLDFTAQSPGFHHHGRYLTHTLLRIALQWGEPWLNIIMALLFVFVLGCFLDAVQPGFFLGGDSALISPALLFFALTALCARPLNTFWFNHSIFFSYFFFMALLLLFLKPYLRLIAFPEDPPSPNIALLALGSFLAGSLHEQGAALLLLLPLTALFLRPKRIPPWYWVGYACYCAGFAVLYSGSRAPSRLIEHGNVLTWDFFGQKINWLNLGWKRYLYSFVRNYLATTFGWFYAAAALGTGWLILRNFRTRPSQTQTSIFFLALSLLTAGAMVLSPEFGVGPQETALFFLYTALVREYYANIVSGTASLRIQRAVSLLSFTALLVSAAFIPKYFPLGQAQAYRSLRAALAAEAALGRKNPTVAEVLPTTEGINTSYLNFHPWFFSRYGFESITVTNGRGESITFNPNTQKPHAPKE